MTLIFSLWAFRSCVAIFKRHLHIEYIFQQILYSGTCSFYHDFDDRVFQLKKTVNQGFLVENFTPHSKNKVAIIILDWPLRNMHFSNNHGYPLFPYLCGNISVSPAYGVYVSQLIRYSRVFSNYQGFLKRAMLLSHNLLHQGYIQSRLKSCYISHFLN